MSSRWYEPWADACGVPVTTAARVEQVGVHKSHGALPSRRGKAGVVAELGRSRVAVLFDGEPAPVGVRPYLLQVIEQPEVGGMTDLEGLHWHGYVRHAEDELAEPTLLDRKTRLAENPHAVLRSPSLVAEWITKTSCEQGGRFALWFPAAARWMTYEDVDQAELRMEAVKLAARAGGVYAAVWPVGGGTRCEMYAEAVTAEDCPEHGGHDEQGA